MKAIQVQKHGGPEVLSLADVPQPAPKAGEVLVKIAASGVNFIDVYLREGRYPAQPPFINGQEAAGSIAGLGSDVSG
jgi:NADPH:quinone reductase